MCQSDCQRRVHSARGVQQSRPQTMTAANHDDQLDEIYPVTLNELNCTFCVTFSRFHWCGHRGHGLWPSWYIGPARGRSRTGLDTQICLNALLVDLDSPATSVNP